MKWHLIWTVILIAYSAILIKVMVFKDLPTIRIGQLMLNFAGTDTGHAPNFVPLKTIVPYLLGHKGLIIAGVNLVGNIILLVPLGFLVPLVYRSITWKQSLALSIASGLGIEILQVVLRVGIFDIDDVILNALGFMIGYGAFRLFAKWMRSKSYVKIILTVVAVVLFALSVLYAVYPKDMPVRPEFRAGSNDQSGRLNNEEAVLPAGEDLCGGTGGNGQIVSVKDNTFTLKLKDDSNLVVNLAAEAAIETSAGLASAGDLKTGDKVTLIGGPDPDGSFTADTVVVCGG